MFDNKLKKGIMKWAIGCSSIIILYAFLGDIGALFGVVLSLLLIKSGI